MRASAVKRCVVGIMLSCVCWQGDAFRKFHASTAFNTETIEHGRLVSKRSVVSCFGGAIRSDRMGLYGDLKIVSPLRYKSVFPNRWAISAGYLGKLTEHFTLDIGGRYTFLQRMGFESIKQWMEYYIGARSGLLMNPKVYFTLDPKRKKWGVEFGFNYDFDLSIFDCEHFILDWQTTFGFFKGRRPYGFISRFNRKYRYYYIETACLLKWMRSENLSLYCGPKFVYNTGGTQSWCVVNSVTPHSHFCGLCFGAEINF